MSQISGSSQVLPTKIALIQTISSLKTSRTIHGILDDKREVLLKRLNELISEAERSREDIWDPLSNSYRQLYDSYLKLGPARLESIASNTPPTIDVSVEARSIASVSIPTLRITQSSSAVGITYGFADTDASLDKATRTMRSVLPKLLKAAENENAIFRLVAELEKTQRLLNALEHIIMPQYESTIRFITARLEEREREEFVTLKHLKKLFGEKKESP
jgi:V/A-type H+/Na+-transporting ATPase subunit D